MSVLNAYLIKIVIFALAMIAVFILTRAIISIAPTIGWVEKSNKRSSHKGQLAFGGGVAVIIITLAMWLFFSETFDTISIVIFISVAILALVSALDDMKTIPPFIRIMVHIIAISTCLYFLSPQSKIFPFDFPIIIDRILAGFFWLWFVNLFNFMDGIDGMAASETISITIGIILIAIFFTYPDDLLILSIILSGAMAGFLPWNWHKAKIMLGDMGSIPIGFLLGFLLINLAIQGYFLVAIILPLYYLSDASLTLLLRLFRGKKIWQAHREHFYQRAVQTGFAHNKIVIKVILGNILLIGVALLSIYQPLLSILLAAIVIFILLFNLQNLSKK